MSTPRVVSPAPLPIHPPVPSKPIHPPIVVSRTSVAPPSTTASAFIGAAEAKRSLGLTKDVPGVQTLEAAIAMGPANHVPAAVTSALRAYISTPQCATTIANARLIAQFTVQKLNGHASTPPKLSGPVVTHDVAAAAGAAAGQTWTHRKDAPQSTHDRVTSVNAVLAVLCDGCTLPIEAVNQLVYMIWGDDGVNFIFGSPLPDPDEISGSGDGGGDDPFPTQTMFQRIQDNVTTFGNSSGVSTQTPADNSQSMTHDSEQ